MSQLCPAEKVKAALKGRRVEIRFSDPGGVDASVLADEAIRALAIHDRLHRKKRLPQTKE